MYARGFKRRFSRKFYWPPFFNFSIRSRKACEGIDKSIKSQYNPELGIFSGAGALLEDSQVIYGVSIDLLGK